MASFALAARHHGAGRLEEALALYQETLLADPAHGEALTGLCQVLEILHRSDEAVPFLDRALGSGFDPRLDAAWDEFQLGHVDQAVSLFREAAEAAPEPALATIATIIPGSPRCDNLAILDARRRWAELCLPSSQPPKSRPRPSGKLRIGYVSSFFQSHNWMKPVWGLINHHDRRNFQIHLFSDCARDRIQHGYAAHPDDAFHDISSLSNDAAAERIELAGIDVLVDLNGYSQTRRLPLFGLRPAPVNVEWFNMYASSGISSVDYLIGDDIVIPREEEKFYCEKIIRVPGSYLTFEVGYPVPDIVDAPSCAGEPFSFGCLAPLYKITPDVVAAFSGILRAAPASVLWLRNSALHSPEAIESVQAGFREHDIPEDRYRLRGPADHYEFLETYNQVDLALDTFPYSGGSTTMEAIWQGVPVVTFIGDRWASRTSASILRAAGLDEFVGRDLEDYVAIAVRFANSPGALWELRRNMRRHLLQTPVCDAARFARDMEVIYRRIAAV